jgi:ABC-type multidrug transport system permease subunit
MLIAGTARALLNACVILIFAPVFGISIHLSAWFIPIVILASLSLSGVALIIGTWSPSMEFGTIVSSIAATVIGLMSPVFYPVSRLPDWLEPIAHLSPYTHAAKALTAVLSGQTGIADEVAILTAITVAGLVIGLAGMRWREV